MSRFLVIGCSGSGKSTLACAISNISSVPYFDTDAMYWQPDWSLLSNDEVIKQLPLKFTSWVIDGTFIKNRKEVWSQADHIIWLNISWQLVLWRVLKRNLGWCFLRPSSWTGNRMPLKIALSGVLHSIRQSFRHKKSFPTYLKEFDKKQIHVLKIQAEYTA